MDKGKAQRAIVWGLGTIAAALLLCLGGLVFGPLRERLFPDPSRALVGKWVVEDNPGSLIEFTEKMCIERIGDRTYSSPYRIASIDGRRVLLTIDPGEKAVEGEKDLIELPFSFESRDVLVIKLRRGEDLRLRRKG